MTKKTVIFVCHAGAYEDDPGDAEMWGLCSAWMVQSNLTRLYHMDSLDEPRSAKRSQFVKAAAKLDIPVICQMPVSEIARSEAFPLEETVDFFGTGYFTSTMAYMLADAIRMGFEKRSRQISLK